MEEKMNKTFTEEEILKLIDEFEKENQESIRTEDLINKKILIADYIKWDKFRKLKLKFQVDGKEVK